MCVCVCLCVCVCVCVCVCDCVFVVVRRDSCIGLGLSVIAAHCYSREFSDEGFRASGTGCPNLQHIDLCYYREVSGEGFRALSAGCPNLQHIFDCLLGFLGPPGASWGLLWFPGVSWRVLVEFPEVSWGILGRLGHCGWCLCTIIVVFDGRVRPVVALFGGACVQ